jgi:N-acetylglutamate synthase-like GNAT family acetyltransferase
MLTLRPARSEDSAAVEALLRAADLPWQDVAEHLGAFIVGEQGGALVACGGLELYASDALLRSVALAPALRGRGLGRALCDTLLGVARCRGVRDLWLLTTTAADFFAAQGFARVDREQAPAAIRATRELTTLCPASAALMHRTLSPH